MKLNIFASIIRSNVLWINQQSLSDRTAYDDMTLVRRDNDNDQYLAKKATNVQASINRYDLRLPVSIRFK